MSKLSIVIPVFNEMGTLQVALDRIHQKVIPGVEKEIIIVESNSNDGSREFVQNFARKYGHQLILQDKALGKGLAVREGMQKATGDIILIQDADLEYEVEDYDKLVEPILKGKTDFVLGSRHLGQETWQIRDFESGAPFTAFTMNAAHWVFTWIFNILYNQRTTDPATMYKVFKRSCLKGLDFQCNRFDFDFELVGKLSLAGFNPVEVPVTYRARGFKQGKKVRFFHDPITWIRVLFGVRIRWALQNLFKPRQIPRESEQ